MRYVHRTVRKGLSSVNGSLPVLRFLEPALRRRGYREGGIHRKIRGIPVYKCRWICLCRQILIRLKTTYRNSMLILRLASCRHVWTSGNDKIIHYFQDNCIHSEVVSKNKTCILFSVYERNSANSDGQPCRPLPEQRTWYWSSKSWDDHQGPHEKKLQWHWI